MFSNSCEIGVSFHRFPADEILRKVCLVAGSVGHDLLIANWINYIAHLDTSIRTILCKKGADCAH